MASYFCCYLSLPLSFPTYISFMSPPHPGNCTLTFTPHSCLAALGLTLKLEVIIIIFTLLSPVSAAPCMLLSSLGTHCIHTMSCHACGYVNTCSHESHEPHPLLLSEWVWLTTLKTISGAKAYQWCYHVWCQCIPLSCSSPVLVCYCLCQLGPSCIYSISRPVTLQGGLTNNYMYSR